jgi:uncharacterized membrane protein (UPF0127 family)
VKEVRVLNRAGEVVVERCYVADRPWQRMRGLLGKRLLPVGEGVLLQPAGSVHSFFMRFPIDVVFLDRELAVVGVAAVLPPWRIARSRGAKSALELPAGEARRRGLKVGERLRLRG